MSHAEKSGMKKNTDTEIATIILTSSCVIFTFRMVSQRHALYSILPSSFPWFGCHEEVTWIPFFDTV